MITQSRLKELLHYNEETGVFTWKVRRGVVPPNAIAGTKTKKYIEIFIDGRQYQAHRLAWLYVHGEFPPYDTDHINRITLDNRIANLRPATRSENKQNISSPNANNKEGLLGVSKHGLRYKAQIMVSGYKRHIGIYDTAQEASEAYIKEKMRIHPFFNNQNPATMSNISTSSPTS